MPKIFISATSRDLKSYRFVVAEWAKARGYEVVVQDEFPVQSDYDAIHHMLRDRLAPCDAIIHLAGLFYGFEPTNVPQGATRRSYTQLEFELGKILKRQLFRFIARPDYRSDQSFEQTDEQRELQLRHRERLTSGNELYYEFSNPEELRQLLEKIEIRQTVMKPRNLPFRSLGSLFKGRDRFLGQLRQVITNKPTHIAAVTATQAIHGMGGIGKTRTAIEYAWKFEHEYTALLFVTADSPENFNRNLADLCGAMVLDLPEKHEPEQEVQLKAVIKWLRENVGWFLIVDNVDSVEAANAVERQLIDLSNGHVVVTSRLADWGTGIESLELDVLDLDSAAEFLLEKTNGKRRSTPSDSEDARKLANDVGGLALALEQAGAFIGKHRGSFAEYRQRWAKQEKKVLTWFDQREMKYPKSVAVTWETTEQLLSDEARTFLRILCWLAPAPIPLKMLNKLKNEKGQVEIDVESALAELRSYSPIKQDADSETGTIHRLVQEIIRFQIPTDQRIGYLKRGLQLIDDFVEGDPQDVTTWPKIYSPACPHVLAIVSHADGHDIADPTSRLMSSLGVFHVTRCEFSQAESLLWVALAIDERCYGAEHPSIATDLSNLAQLLKETNRFEEAESFMMAALHIDERAYGLQSHKVVIHLSNLGQLLKETNRPDEAERQMRRALEIAGTDPGANHPNIGILLNNLAEVLFSTGQFQEAELLFLRAIEVDEQTYGTDHPNVARDLNNYAGLLRATFRSQEAELLFRRGLDIVEKEFGLNHTCVATQLNNLGVAIQDTNRLDEAEALYRRAIEIDERLSGFDHPNVGRDLHNLSRLYLNNNMINEAEPLMRRSLKIFFRFHFLSGRQHWQFAPVLAGYCDVLGSYDLSQEEIETRILALQNEVREEGD